MPSMKELDELIKERWGGPVEEVRANIEKDTKILAKEMGIDLES